MEYKDLERVNKEMIKTDIKGKNYAPVQERIKAFRKLYPDGEISTEMLSNENGVCVFKARVLIRDDKSKYYQLSTGYAYEKEGNGFINKTSYIENAETSAVGRALGFAGFGIDESIASYEEVANAKLNQVSKEEMLKPTPELLERIKAKYKGDNLKKLLETQGVEKLEDIPLNKINELLEKIGGKK